MRLPIATVTSLSLSLVTTAMRESLRAQTVGNWLPPVQFPNNYVGCNGNDNEPVYAVHASLIPVGPHRGKVLIWDRSASFLCSVFGGAFSGDRDQRWAIVDPEAGTVAYFVWTIPAAFAPPVYGGALGAITNGAQGLFCASHCWLPDGRLLAVGGDDWSGAISAGYAQFTGSRLVCVYDPQAGPDGTWVTAKEPPLSVPSMPALPFLEIPRWYPTAVVTYRSSAPGIRRIKVVVLGGVEQIVENPESQIGNGIFLATDRAYLTHEAYDLTGGTTPTDLWEITKDDRPGGSLPINYSPNTPTNGVFIGPQTSTSLPDYKLGYSLFYYARAHYLSNAVLGGATYANGLTWAAGMATGTAWVDHPAEPNLWPLPNPILTANWSLLEEPTGVLLPASLLGGGEDRIALFGGQYGPDHTGPVTADVSVLDAKVANPAWVTGLPSLPPPPPGIPAMNHARKFANATLLPDRSVLITGGGTNPEHGGSGGEVLKPEVFRGTVWQDGPPEASPRTYHSCTLLLQSGRVATMGGDSRTWDLQVFEPHYFQPGTTRPVLTSPAPTAAAMTIAYNSTFSISYTLAAGRSLQSASLTTPGSLTHGHDPNQRLVELGIVGSSATTATLAAPVSPTKAPYGYYMLWIVDSAGEVSVAAWVQLW